MIILAENLFAGDRSNPWVRFLRRQLEAWRTESGDAELPLSAAREFLYEACADSRRDHDYGEGVLLSTVHAAKGTEFDHVVLVGPWPLRGDPRQREEQRRAFYVGLTRARHTLTILEQGGEGGSLPGTLDGPGVMVRELSVLPALTSAVSGYETLGLDDIHLGYPACFPGGHPIHHALAELRPGNRLRLRRRTQQGEGAGLVLVDVGERVVARLSRRAEAAWSDRLATVRDVRVLALVHRRAE